MRVLVLVVDQELRAYRRQHPPNSHCIAITRSLMKVEPFFLEGDAYRSERRTRAGQPDWDLASIAAPEAAVLFALDTAYTADAKANVFQFGPPRPANFAFALPAWLRSPKEVFRVDADGITDVKWSATGEGVVIEDTRSRDANYVATSVPSIVIDPANGFRNAVMFESSVVFPHPEPPPINMISPA
jgi:hypothetical protein